MAEVDVEKDMIERLRGGDKTACAQCVEMHAPGLYRLAYRLMGDEAEAEDVVQETFLNAFKSIDAFEWRSGLKTWLYRIATFAALKVIRKRKGLDTISLEAATEPREDYDSIPHPEYIADWKQSPEQLVERNETQRLLDDAGAGRAIHARHLQRAFGQACAIAPSHPAGAAVHLDRIVQHAGAGQGSGLDRREDGSGHEGKAGSPALPSQ